MKQLINRLHADPVKQREDLISIDNEDVPNWQRQTVWNEDEMGLLAASIILNYPIGMIILWKKTTDGVRVPIDGRQRLTAIKHFVEGRIAIPTVNMVPDELKGRKYILLPGDLEKGIKELAIKDRDNFDGYELSIVQYEKIPEPIAMDIFVCLQRGKVLTKTETRAALGGRLCNFVTKLTSAPRLTGEDEEDDEESPSESLHPFFKQVNVRNSRKAHRNLCDVMLHEFLNPGQDKHWSSLESMYRDKAQTLTAADEDGFRTSLGKFLKAFQKGRGFAKKLVPQLRSAFLILTVFRAWRELTDQYALPDDFSFADSFCEFERLRVENSDESPWQSFTNELSNAGYSKNRIDSRHAILMSFLLRKCEGATLRDTKRTFSEEQKLAIWDRAGHQCEWLDGAKRCKKVLENFREGDADHIVKWSSGGPTSLANGRLLCQKHNRMPRP
ncbi:MAG: DUF262 domain-containing protein [Planctomycetota bacterium]